MYKVYFKQAIQMIRQNVFISIISILGTALSIMMIMTLVLAYQIKNISVAPEDKRHRTLYVSYHERNNTANSYHSSGVIRRDIVNDFLNMETPEVISTMVPPFDTENNNFLVKREGDKKSFHFYGRNVDNNFWLIYSFNFIEGRAFTREEFMSESKVAVISESVAKKIFNNISVIGEKILIDYKTYKVIGVVRDVSPVFKKSRGEIWIPYTKKAEMFEIVILAKTKNDFPIIDEEVRSLERKYNVINDPIVITYKGPDNHRIDDLDFMTTDNEKTKLAFKLYNRKMIFIFLMLLLIPAVNLSSFSFARIKKRMSEIGIRKAFGAKKYIIFIQVLYENMITSLVGGILGLFLSYGVLMVMKRWLLGISFNDTIPLRILLSPWAFLVVFLICLLINLLSAGIPAYRVSKTTIVNSLKQNEKL